MILLFNGSGASAEGTHGGTHEGGLAHGSPWLSFGYGLFDIVFLVLIGAVVTRNLKKIPGPMQNFLEILVGGLDDFFSGVLGPGAQRHTPILITMFLYILTMNLMGLTGVLVPPTASLNMTVALALVAIVYVQLQGIRAHGIKGYIMHFVGEPIWLFPLMLPLHIIGELAKPLSLSFRLFGNIFGEETVMVQLALLGPLVLFGSKVIPIQFPLLPLGLLKCIIQAVVFTTLMAVYLVIMASEHEEHAAHYNGEEHSGVNALAH